MVLGRVWGVLGRVWVVLGRFLGVLVCLGRSWRVSGAFWERLKAFMGRLGGPFWPPLAPFGHHFGTILEALESHLASPGEGSRNVPEIPRF